MNDNDLDRRLTRIENKLDKLCDTVAELGRIDERLNSQGQLLEKGSSTINDLRLRIVSLEKVQASRAWIDRVVWAALAAMCAGFFYLIR